MAEKKSGLKKLFSKPKKDCCSIEIEEAKANESNGCKTAEQKSDTQKKEA
ncbi:hypothetical protein ERJ70_03305 [Sediminibacillus dalangtanensis]|uniref:Uncharacterized protein n=1 Tax=Sediminibacillus dalangtanensis TaxID=2729421 RepID=A0ABX7VNK5_9BACI|nr:hypothetical protein [Sediminibacillus dalangtanensis]QTM98414.1 hypothetical protein ERJ70_03305 [Sediminibacillus dalangtanensis]